MRWYLEALRKYARFSGRARRREYWCFALVNALVYLALLMVDVMLGSSDGDIGVISALYLIGTAIPGLAVTIRRLHDTGRSGWWLLVSFVPLIGLIVMLVFTLQDSDRGANEYGSSPKYSAVAAV